MERRGYNVKDYENDIIISYLGCKETVLIVFDVGIDVAGHSRNLPRYDFVTFFALPLDTERINPVKELEREGMHCTWSVLGVIRNERHSFLALQEFECLLRVLNSVRYVTYATDILCSWLAVLFYEIPPLWFVVTKELKVKIQVGVTKPCAIQKAIPVHEPGIFTKIFVLQGFKDKVTP